MDAPTSCGRAERRSGHWNAPGEVSASRRYTVALLCLAGAFLLRFALDPVIRGGSIYGFFLPAAMLAAWYGRFLAGLLVLSVGALLGYYVFALPQFFFGPLEASDFAQLFVLGIAGLGAIWVMELLHRARERERENVLGLEREITERQRAEKELRLAHEILQAIPDAESFNSALGLVVHKLCEFANWAAGHGWVPVGDPSKMELCRELCHCGVHERLVPFSEMSCQMRFEPGQGMIGKVWQTKQPLWIRDVSRDQTFLRAAVAAESGIKAAVAVPVLAREKVVAILEFFMLEDRPEDERFVRLVETIAAQLGTLMERKQAEEALKESRRRLAEAEAMARLGNWEWNVASNEVTWSDELYRIFDIPPDEFRGTFESFLQQIHPADRSYVESLLAEAFKTGEPFAYKHRITRRDGSVRTLHCQGKSIRDSTGQIQKMLGTAQDVTEEELAQSELENARGKLAEYAATLEDKVAERTAELESSVKDMEGFCYTIAHDLRAPARAMQGFATAILQDYAPRLDEAGHEYSLRIIEAAHRMDQLIEDLLEYGRLSHLDLPRAWVSLGELVTTTVDQFKDDIQRTHATIEVAGPLPETWTNPALLGQILSNLISNSLKFVPSGARPDIRIWAENQEGFVRIHVADKGIGIAPEHHERVFRVFEKLHRPSAYQGTGIGLAIVSKGVERLGGRIHLESEPGKGSHFWFELPKPDEPPEPSERISKLVAASVSSL